MALNPIAYTEKIVRSFLKYQLTAYPFADHRLHGQMWRVLSMDEVHPDAGICITTTINNPI